MATEFGYLLNAMERAACESNPAKHNYHDKRIAVLGHVSAIEAERDRLRAELAEARRDAIAEDIGDAGADARIEARTVVVLGSKRYEEKAGWTCAGCAFLVPVEGCSKTPEQRTALKAAFSGSCPERGVVYVEVKDA